MVYQEHPRFAAEIHPKKVIIVIIKSWIFKYLISKYIRNNFRIDYKIFLW